MSKADPVEDPDDGLTRPAGEGAASVPPSTDGPVPHENAVPDPPRPGESMPAYVARRRNEADDDVRPNRSLVYRAAKRLLDLAVAVPLLILALPFMGLIALMIRLESPGPAIFRQKRVARHGHLITFYKFRTMYDDAQERFPDLYRYELTPTELDKVYYKPVEDPRNTRFGAFIRRTTLDELPNLVNVVIGNVSLVGPRPEMPEMIGYYRPEELVKFSVKSGVTGLAQVTGRNTLTIHSQIAADVEYVRNQSMRLDLAILWRTLWAVLRRDGAT